MQPSASVRAELHGRHQALLQEVRRAPGVRLGAGEGEPAVPALDTFIREFAPSEQIGHARHLLWAAMATPSAHSDVLVAVGHAMQGVGSRQSEHFARLFADANQASPPLMDDAMRRRRFGDIAQSTCMSLVGWLGGLSPEAQTLPDSLHDHFETLRQYVSDSVPLDGIWRQGLLYRGLVAAEGFASGNTDEKALFAWADEQVEAAYKNRVLAVATQLFEEEPARERRRGSRRGGAR